LINVGGVNRNSSRDFQAQRNLKCRIFIMLKSYFGRLGRALLTSRRGATAIEYGILAALIGAVLAAAAGPLGTAVSGALEDTTATIPAAAP